MPSFARRIQQHNAIKRRKRKAPKWQHGSSLGRTPIKRYNLADRPLDYETYLQGPYWRALRKEILALRSTCEQCGIDRRLNLHHLYYYKQGKSVLYRERQHTDIFAVLCHDCHMRLHNACSPAVLGVQPITKASTPR